MGRLDVIVGIEEKTGAFDLERANECLFVWHTALIKLKLIIKRNNFHRTFLFFGLKKNQIDLIS